MGFVPVLFPRASHVEFSVLHQVVQAFLFSRNKWPCSEHLCVPGLFSRPLLGCPQTYLSSQGALGLGTQGTGSPHLLKLGLPPFLSLWIWPLAGPP